MRQTEAMQSASTHGHAILNYIIEQGGQVDIDKLRQWAHTEHGDSARYHTCSVEGLPLDGILQFLAARSKISVQDGCVSVNVQNICSHEERQSDPREP
jgi:probable metal-binding protein